MKPTSRRAPETKAAAKTFKEAAIVHDAVILDNLHMPLASRVAIMTGTTRQYSKGDSKLPVGE